jgi:phage baseplate assembly protein W
MTISRIIIDVDEELKEIESRLKLLLTTPKGTMPMDREYGIDFEAIIDKPLNVAENCYATEVIKAVGAYETNVNTVNVECRPTSESSFEAIITLARKGATQWD